MSIFVQLWLIFVAYLESVVRNSTVIWLPTLIFRTGQFFPIDIYGQGPHAKEIQADAIKRGLPVSGTWVSRMIQ